MTSSFDRHAHLRAKPDAVAAERAHPEARVTLVWRGKSLLDGERRNGLWLPLPEAPWAIEVYLGRTADGHPRFAADLSNLEDVEAYAEGGRFSDLMRAGWGMDPAELHDLAYARGMAHWHRSTSHCGNCGTELDTADGGFKRQCPGCGATVFPRTDPAVMILVTKGDRCLLARQPRFPPQMYSALAGFVEPGESLEACVLRETKEEVGLEALNPRYFGSQPWPFPQSLMVGYTVDVEGEDFQLDEEELEAARWFSREELANPDGFFYPPAMSLAHHMIRAFIKGA
ncbi:MAG: NAD(+) diphosphatase [Myxococcota bacterium]